MLIVFVILLMLACLILGLIVLVQNPKGGGLTGNIAGFSNQFMGVKQTTDVLEKGTWIFAAVVAVLCITSPIFIKKEGGSKNNDLIEKVSTSGGAQKSPVTPGTSTPAK